MKVKYLGPKAEKTMEFPIPLLSRGDKECEIRWTKGETKEIDDKWAAQLREHAAGTFEVLEMPKPSGRP